MQRNVNGGGRIFLIDYAKLLGVYITVLGHLYSIDSEQRVYIYAFHMPLFFLISGFLHKDRRFAEELIHVLFKLLLPALFFIFIFILFGSFMYSIGIWDSIFVGVSYHLVVYCQIKQFVSALIYSTDLPNLICWFLFTLSWCRIAKSMIINTRLLILFILLFPIVMIYIRYGFIANAFMALPYYLFGYACKRKLKKIESFKSRNILIAVSVLSVISLFLIKFNGRVSMSGILWGRLGLLSVPLFYLNGLLGSAVVIMAAEILRRFSVIKEISNLSNSFISILGFQYFFIYTIIHYLGYNNSIIVSCVLSVIVIILCYFIHRLFFFHIQNRFNIWQQYMMQKFLDFQR